MTYAIDPELAPFVASIPSGSFVDPVPARRFFEDVNAMLSAGIDTSALVIEDGSVPGEAGRPPVPIRIYRPKDAPDVSDSQVNVLALFIFASSNQTAKRHHFMHKTG